VNEASARYDYSAMTAETVRQGADEGLAEADRLIAQAVDAAGPRTFENTLLPLSDAAAAVWTADGRGALIGRIHPDSGVRDAANAARERTEKWRNGLAQRDEVAACVRGFAGTREAGGLSGARRRVLDLWLRDLRRAGHELEPSSRAELATLRERIIELAVIFDRQLRDWSDAIELAANDLDGLAQPFVEQLLEGSTAGTKSLPIVWSTVLPFLEQSTRRDLRELALRKFLSLAADANRPVLEDTLALRRRVAALMGAPSWSQFANEARMSGGAEAVRAFLDRILPPLEALATGERARMRELLHADGVDDELQAWDWFHCHERQRRAIGLDSSALSAHFPLDAVLGGLFDIVRDVFGVEVTENRAVTAWHPDVRLFVLRDVVTGERLADCYVDFFMREGKSPGAWMDQLEPGSNRPGSPRRPAVLYLVTNLAPAPHRIAQPLLQHDDVATLFHEFGHVLEFGLQRAEVFFASPSWIELDFVEAPSQIMEHWVWAPEVLRQFARHHETGQPPPEALLERLAESRRLNIGLVVLWYAYRAVLDQALHGPDPVDPGEAFRKAFALTGLPFPEGTFQPSSFHHILMGYDAGYYSYLWAQVFGDDMFSAFRSEGLLSGAVGRRYRAQVLEPTWTVPGRDRVRNFLGREPSEEAFLELLGITGLEGLSESGLPPAIAGAARRPQPPR
jgi:thimet oligopeptidase